MVKYGMILGLIISSVLCFAADKPKCDTCKLHRTGTNENDNSKREEALFSALSDVKTKLSNTTDANEQKKLKQGQEKLKIQLGQLLLQSLDEHEDAK